MKFLRTSSTRTLLATIAGALAAVAAGTTIAIAAAGGGPVPPAKPLALAIHDALGAQPVQGIYARITFTNHLIDSSNIQGSDPILSGASGRLWLSSDHRLRLELQSGNGDAQIVVNNGSFWIYDPSANTVYEGTIPKALTGGSTKHAAADKADKGGLPSIATIQSDLNRLMGHVNLSGAIPGDIAHQAAYTVRIAPKHDGGLLGAVEVAWDAVHGVPLRFAVYATGNPSPVLELTASHISYGRLSSSDFTAAPPAGAKVVKISTASLGDKAKHAARERALKRHAKEKPVNGVAAVARHLQFTLVAPSSVVGLPRRTVSLLNMSGSPAALVAYGQNLGGIVVIETKAHKGTAPSVPLSGSSGDHHRGLSLPTVSINGVTAQELDTALGTVLHFTRNGVTYIVLGSVPPAAADAAARAL